MAEIQVEREAPGRFLGLDDGFDRQRELTVEPEALLERRSEETTERGADRIGLAIDQVLAGEAVDG